MKQNAYPQAKTTTKADLGSWLDQARAQLVNTAEQPATEAQVLAATVLKKERSWILAHPEYPLDPTQHDQLSHLLERLLAGEPLPYLTGSQAFYGLDFWVNPSVLIPRPETELLVDRALAWIDAHPMLHHIVDVGSGSGCIAVSIAKLRPSVQVVATEGSYEALCVARANARRHQVEERIQWVQADLLSPVQDRFGLVTANLPYIESSHLADLPVSRYEPRFALDGGEDGLSYIRGLIADAPRWLARDGCLLLEIEYTQGQAVLGLARAVFPGALVRLHHDYSGLDRLVEINNG